MKRNSLMISALVISLFCYCALAQEQTAAPKTPKITKKQMKELQEMAVRAFQSVECSGLARVDFLMDPKNGKIYLNEINTMPGFTSISMYPKLWAASGLAYPDLIDRLIELAMERYAEKKKNRYSKS